MELNIFAAWIGFTIGGISGAIPGLFFHGESWLGGYGSWKRRMLRLGHISFFGLGGLNLAFALTARSLGIEERMELVGILLIIGAILMPTVCYLSAWKQPFRHVFFIPASSIIIGTALFAWSIMP
jgi:hypothetical protein